MRIIAGTVLVLGVLHDLHQRVEGYTYWHLLKLFEAYGPDLMTIEVGPHRFAAGDFRSDSCEKWGVALPWGVEHGIPVVPTDGEGQGHRDYEAEHQQAMDELVARPGAKQAIAEFERQLSEYFGPDPMATFVTLCGSYEKANRAETQGIFRWTHTLGAATYGEGILTDFWQDRNENMARRTVEAMERHGARRALITVGAEHKYALDDLLRDEYGLQVMQLRDFLSSPITLTPDEHEAFRRGQSPIKYPSDLMFVHRKLHGGEPNSYQFELPLHPQSLDLDGVSERIERALAQNQADPDMTYYRGMLGYAEGRFSEAARDFDRAVIDRSRMVALSYPLWQLAALRAGQMQDLLGDRQAACERYRAAADGGIKRFRFQAAGLLEQPFRADSAFQRKAE